LKVGADITNIYAQLLQATIPKAQKDTDDVTVFWGFRYFALLTDYIHYGTLCILESKSYVPSKIIL